MRMWMVNPRGLCRKHLLGEHSELHILAAWLAKGRKVDGWADSNCYEPASMAARHEALAVEMGSRGWNHASPLAPPRIFAHQRPDSKVDRKAALKELIRRCPECAIRLQKISRK